MSPRKRKKGTQKNASHKSGKGKKNTQGKRQNPPSQPEEAKESVAAIHKQANAQNIQQNQTGSTSDVVSLEPLAPIIVGSGRPFGQSVANSALFPPPSTVAGCLRTAWARETGTPFGPNLAKISVDGPLLLNCDNQVLVPKPADALYFGHGNAAVCVRTEPRQFDDGGADLPDGLLPVQLTKEIQGKPGDGPDWWSLDDLLVFRSGKKVAHADLCKNGWTPPAGDRRTHVAIDRLTGAADAGKLFQTEGMDFAAQVGDNSVVGTRLLVRCGKELDKTLVHLGGERRLAELQPEPEAWPNPPKGWLAKIQDSDGLCLTLLTPGIFSAGYRPGWLNESLTGSPPAAPGLQLQLRAVAIDRWQPHSGWDLAKQQPRPTRKLAGAGTTYWFRILDGSDSSMLEALWLTSVSDLDQDRRDGFGLALPSPWKPI